MRHGQTWEQIKLVDPKPFVDPLPIPVVIIAGGQSLRFGSPKGLIEFNGVRLIDWVIESLKHQTSAPLVINSALDGPYRGLGSELLPDPIEGQLGPLVGLLAAMIWAQNEDFDHVLTAPIDTPFLPSNLVRKLVEEGAPAIGSSNNIQHSLCGLWPVELQYDLRAFLDGGGRAAWRWAQQCEARTVAFENDQKGRDPFFNVNTKEDLDRYIN